MHGASSPAGESSGSATPAEQPWARSSLERMWALLQRERLTDVVLVAAGRRLPAHRLVLAAASDYFTAMFAGDLREAGQHEVVLRDVDPDALSSLLRYCYTAIVNKWSKIQLVCPGEIELREETVEVVLATANLLQLPRVVQVCCSFLSARLHPSNCLGISMFAESQGCSQLHSLAHSYIMLCVCVQSHFLEVVHCQEFLMLCADEVRRLLLCDELNVPGEEAVFRALLTWIHHDLSARQSRLAPLLGAVRLPLLSPQHVVVCQFLTDHVESNPLFHEDRGCQELLLEALKYHLLPERRLALQSPRTRPRKSTVGSLLIVGGLDGYKGSTQIQRYDLRTDTWSQFSTMNGRRLQFGAAVLDNRLYVVGGRDGLKTLNTVECFDLRAKVWQPVASMSTHRHGLGVGVLEGPMYAVGGHDGWSYLNTVERWDPQSFQWSYIAPMNTQRSTAGICVLNNRLYAVGGRDGSSCLRSMECYDPHTNRWTLCAAMSRRRGGVGVGAVNGYLFALGGHDTPAVNPTATRFDCVERYDPKTDTWTTVAPMGVRRDAVGVCLLGDQLFAIGGYDGQSYLSLVEAYDPQNNEWEQVRAALVGWSSHVDTIYLYLVLLVSFMWFLDGFIYCDKYSSSLIS
ncbi:KLHL4 [Cordylochernes scorpioides]|uniref:Kelch-like protein diablo n=1 Tax=Cordylochernes scorpioides TaxID=51811 RepID=A0ABY6K710_9ARAC|nr:KLHL4 [Cordylochernes scorpioides]